MSDFDLAPQVRQYKSSFEILWFNCGMKKILCPACGGDTKRNGKTSSGATRWRCKSCGASTTQRYSGEAANFAMFMDWLLSKKTQEELGVSSRTFRRRTARFWDLWPVAPVCDEIHHVVHVDGIWLGHQVVVLIACTDEHAVGWHLARSESAQAWAALMARIAPPDVVVTDGGSGFEKARRAVWPKTRVQRCVFHAFAQVKRQTTTRPKLEAGVELYGIAKKLMCVRSLDEAATWLASLSNWCSMWEAFLKERTVVDGRLQYRHGRLRRARRGLEKLARAGMLFTYLDEGLVREGVVPATNNRIEGGINAQLRHMLRTHRGLSLDRRIKAIFWWCFMHAECPPSSKELKEMPTDRTISTLYQAATDASRSDEAVERWGAAVSWSDLHVSAPWRSDWD